MKYIYHNLHKNLPLDAIPSLMNQVQIPTPYFLKINVNIILPFTPGSLKWFYPSKVFN
jgi:hypothetical protein